jgi:hypothetical protein
MKPVVLGHLAGEQADGGGFTAGVNNWIIRSARPAFFQFRDQCIGGIAGVHPAAARGHLELPKCGQLLEVLLVTLCLTGNDIQPLQILWVDEGGLLLLYELDDPSHRLVHRLHILLVASGFEADLRVADLIGLIQQNGGILRLIAA